MDPRDLVYWDARTNRSVRLLTWEARGVIAGVLYGKAVLLASLFWSPHREVRPYGLGCLFLAFAATVLLGESVRQYRAESET